VFDRSTDSRDRQAGGSTVPVIVVRWLLRVKEILNLGSLFSECVSMATVDVLMLELSKTGLALRSLAGNCLLKDGLLSETQMRHSSVLELHILYAPPFCPS
jgi:hypothetical protein